MRNRLIQEIAVNYDRMVKDFILRQQAAKKKEENLMVKSKYEVPVTIATDIKAVIEKLNILLDAAAREDMEVILTISTRNAQEEVAVLNVAESLSIAPKIMVKKEL